MTTDNPMQLGMVGLGRMGANLVRRLMRDGHRCVVYDVNPDAVTTLAGEGATGSGSLAEFVAALEQPRAVWVMVPAGDITNATIDELGTHLEPGDIVIDGGNTYYRDDLRHAAALKDEGHPPRRLRHQRRGVGLGPRLLPDDRRRGRGVHAPGADLRVHRARCERGAAFTRSRRRTRPWRRRATCIAGRTAPATS